MKAHADRPWVGDCHCARDAEECFCGHKNVSHGSTVKGEFVGLGRGDCGFCACSRFKGAPVAMFEMEER